MRLCVFLGCAHVLCEVPLFFSPCFPGGSPLADSCSSGPGPQQTQVQTPLGAAASGSGAMQVLPAVGLAAFRPAVWAGPLRVDTLPLEAGL